MRHAKVKDLGQEGFISTAIHAPDCWGFGESPAESLTDLLDVIIDWCAVKLAHGEDDFREVDGHRLP